MNEALQDYLLCKKIIEKVVIIETWQWQTCCAI